MSNDFISSVVQGVESTRSPSKVQAVQNTPMASNQGNEKAAGGNNVPPETERQAGSDAKLDEAISKISDFVQNYQRDLQFSVDKHSGHTVIKVVDSETDKVIRQIPPEHVLKLAQKLSSPESLILKEQA